MRRVILAIALGVLVLAPAASAQRVMVAFIPTEPAPKMPLLFDLEQRNFAYGVSSPSIGSYSKRQMLLDMSSGARIANRAYADKLGRLDLVNEGGKWRVSGWHAASYRSASACGRRARSTSPRR